MHINRDNYQEYAMEWLEGTLGAVEQAAFVRFLEYNPDLRPEVEELMSADPYTPVSSSIPSDFSMLKRSINEKMINAGNCLEFVIARRDGELDEVSLQRLESWLQQHPELHREVAALEGTFMQPDQTILFPDKDSLRHQVTVRGGTIHHHQLEELIIASIEGELTPADQQQLDQYLDAHPEAADLQIALRLTKLTPDPTVTFQNKGALKRRAVVPLMITRTPLIRGLAVAASLALLAGIFLFSPRDEVVIVPPVIETAGKVNNDILQDPVAALAVPDQIRAQRIPESRKSYQQSPALQQVILAENTPQPDPGMPVPKQALRSSGSLIHPLPAGVPAQLARTTLAYNNTPVPATSNSRLTVNEFPVEQIRYFTGGGNERPGLLAELTIPRLIELTNPYERLNNAGQQVITRWNRWKEQAMDEVIPYR
jgi:hypothetical protein